MKHYSITLRGSKSNPPISFDMFALNKEQAYRLLFDFFYYYDYDVVDYMSMKGYYPISKFIPTFDALINLRHKYYVSKKSIKTV